MATSIVSNNTAATFGNSPQKTGEPLDHATFLSGKALEFDGVNDYAQIDYTHTDESFTVAFWVMLHSTPTNNYMSSVIANSYNHIGFYTGRTIYWRQRNGLGNAWCWDANDNQSGSTVLSLNTWHRVVCIHNKSRDQRVWVDGAPGTGDANGVYKEYTGSISTSSTYGYKYIGKAASGNFDGKICDLQIWRNIAWSSDDVEYDYKNPEKLVTSRSGTNTTTAHLNRWYPMNDSGTGNSRVGQTILFDAAGTNNTTKNHATTTFTGDDLMATNRGTFVNSGEELRTGSELSSGAATNHAFYEITAQGWGSNLAVNGDFESSISFGTGDDEWVHEATDAGQNMTGSGDSTGNHRNGSKSMRVTMDGGTTGYLNYKRTDFVVGKSYKVSFWFKKAVSSNVRIGAGTLYRSFTVGDTGNVATSTSYKEYTTTFVATATTMFITININSATDTHYGFLDDFAIYEGTDFTLYGAPDNYPGTIFQMNHASDLVPIFDANNKAYLTVINWDASTGHISNVGQEINTNTTFDDFTGDVPDNWTVVGDDDSGNNISQGTGSTGVRIVSDGTAIYAQLADSLVSGKTYRYAIELADVTDDDVNFNHGGTTFFSCDGKSADTLYTGFFTAGSTYIRIIRSANCDVTVKSFSIKQTDILVFTGDAGGTLRLNNSTDGNTTEDLVVGREYTFVANAREEGAGSPSTGIRAHNGTSAPNAWTPSTDGDVTQTFTLDTSNDTYPNLSVFAQDEGEYTIINSITLKETGVASGWTDADQQDTIPQSALMDGSTKYEFNGTSTEVHMDLAAFTDKSDFSMSAWIFPYGSDFSGVVCGNGEDTNERLMGVQSRALSFTNYNSDGYGSPDSLRATGDPLPSGGYVWTHIVLTYADSGSTIKWYVNGTEHTSTDTGGGWSAQTDTTASNIGFLHRSGGQNYFKGLIDEVSYWNDDLTAAQVSALYNSGTPLNATKSAAASNLVGYWRNNSMTTSSTWEDLSTNNNHATATNLGGSIFFQEGVTANLDTQGMNTTIDHTGSKGAAYFDGVADYIDLGRNISIDGDFTIQFWMKRVSTGSWLVLFGGTTTSYDALYIKSNGVLQLRLGDSSYIDISYTHAMHTWQNIAIVRTDGTVKTYLNASDVSDDETHSGQLNIKVLGCSGALAGFFGGWLDEFMVYDKALTAAEVSKNYKYSASKHTN